MHFILFYFFRVKESMNLSELLIIFVNKVLITPTQGIEGLFIEYIYSTKNCNKGSERGNVFYYFIVE